MTQMILRRMTIGLTAGLLAISAHAGMTATPGFSTAVLKLKKSDPGTETSLQAVPPFVERIFVPVVASTLNEFVIENEPVVEILEVPDGFELSKEGKRLRIAAPDGGAWGYAKVRTGKRDLILTLMNMVPFQEVKNGRLEGYRIGSYETRPLRGLKTYEHPRGLIRLTSDNSDAWVSDKYRLRDFQCKLDGTTKFLMLRTEALIKLELMRHMLRTEKKVEFDRFTIMSGYRTPHYNRAIGNKTNYSRHLYGDAMDIYIDRDGNGNMDDINGDGRIDPKDAKVLIEIAERIDRSKQWGWLQGGGGVYKANSAHGPYAHIDTRGYIARWGL